MKQFFAFICIWILTVILVAFSSPGLFYIASETLYVIGQFNPSTMKLSTQLLQFPAEHDLLSAQRELGSRYAHGQGVEKNPALGLKWIKMAASGDDTQARDMLAFQYSYGCPESERADLLKSIIKGAEQNSLSNQSVLSFAYFYGLGTKPDLQKSFNWCKAAANHNRAQSQFLLARYYEFGLGTAKDEKAMFSWDEKAAKQGFTASQFQLGIDFLNGVAVKQNTQEGLKWLEKAATHGNSRAQTLLGLIYKFHLFDKNDDAVAQKYLSQTAKLKSSIATYLISPSAPKGSDAMKQLQSAAARGDAHASAVIAEMFATGCGAKLSREDSIRWYTTAASNGDSDAQIRLGFLSSYGAVDGNQNFEKSTKLFEQASLAGNVEGMFLYGRNLLSGIGTQGNSEKGESVVAKAAERGSIEAAVLYARLVQNDRKKKKHSLSWLQAAGDSGDAVAQDILSQVDIGDVEKWRKKSADQGYGPALREVAEDKVVGILQTKDTPGGLKILEELSNAGDTEATLKLAEDYRYGLFDTPKDENKAKALLEKEAMLGSATAQLKLADMYRLEELGKDNKDEACKWYDKAAAQESQEGIRKQKQYCDKGKLKLFGDD